MANFPGALLLKRQMNVPDSASFSAAIVSSLEMNPATCMSNWMPTWRGHLTVHKVSLPQRRYCLEQNHAFAREVERPERRKVLRRNQMTATQPATTCDCTLSATRSLGSSDANMARSESLKLRRDLSHRLQQYVTSARTPNSLSRTDPQ